MLSPELIPIHERLVNIRRQLVALATKETASQAAAARDAAEAAAARGPVIKPRGGAQTRPPEDESADSEMESKTPTKDVPNPEHLPAPKVKAELKPLIEELRKIDS